MNNHDEEQKQMAEAIATATKYTLSNYDLHSNGIERDLHLGPIREGESISFTDGKITTNQYSSINIQGIGKSSESHTKETGLFSNNTHDETKANLGKIISTSETHDEHHSLYSDSEKHSTSMNIGGGLFKSNQTTYSQSNKHGNVSGNETETSCCGLRAASSEETSCCTADACCSYHCSTNYCGERLACNFDTVCCFRPICHAIRDINCPRVSNVHCPDLDGLGNCIHPTINFCHGIIREVDFRAIAHCLQEAGPVIMDILECLASIVEPRRH